MTPAETSGLTFADIIAYASALGSPIAAVGIWFFGVVMLFQNRSRAAQAAEDRKVTQAMLAALERQGAALAEIVRRTSPPSSQAGPRPGPAG